MCSPAMSPVLDSVPMEKVDGVPLQAPSITQTAAERALVRKIDWILLPLLTISFGLQYSDSEHIPSQGAGTDGKPCGLPFP